MTLITSFIKNIIFKTFKAFIKAFRWVGILFLVLLLECICIGVYCNEKIEHVEISKEAIQITDISWEKTVNEDGEAGYLFHLTLQNNGSTRAIASGSFIKDEEGYHIRSDGCGIYQAIDNWGSLYSGVIVPPGTQAEAEVFVSSLELDNIDTENLIFQAGLDGEETYFSLKQLNTETTYEEVENRIDQYLNQVTVEELKEIQEEISFSDATWQTLPEEYSIDAFVLLYQVPDEDIALYGLCGGDGMVLRDGEKLYPIMLSWNVTPRIVLPAIYKSDYDGDGKQEYALYRYIGSGTGYSISELCMLELVDKSLQIHEFTFEDMMYRLQNIQYEYFEEEGIVHIDTGSDTYEIEIADFLQTNEVSFSSLTWGDIIDIMEQGGQWWLQADAGIVVEEWVTPQYECGVCFRTPITYMGNGYFQTGSIEVDVIENEYR